MLFMFCFGLGNLCFCCLGLLFVLGLMLVVCGEFMELLVWVVDFQCVFVDFVLVQVYFVSCKFCYVNFVFGVLLIGDVVVWVLCLVQGIDILLDYSINGYKGMLFMGMCMQCLEEQFWVLIDFMFVVQD